MHAINGTCAGQVFALATSNDSDGRKSRIRRSKEERKTMVESFIQNYQKSNNGNFPSLNLTHKEVGGSFYTVREMIREIIQENRVLAPPKVSSEEYSNSEFLEQNPLGSISMEPEIDTADMVSHVSLSKDQISSEENNHQLNESYPLELLDNEQIEEVSKAVDKDEISDVTSESCQGLNCYPINNDAKIVNGIELLEKNSQFDKPVLTSIDREDSNEIALLSSQTINGLGSERSTNDQTVDKSEEFSEIIYPESNVTVTSHVNSRVVVETFPLRPMPKTIHDMDGEYGNLQETDVNAEAIRSSSCVANAKGVEKLTDDEVVLGSSLENSKYSSASKPVVVTIGDFKDLEFEASSCTECLISDDSTIVERKASGQENSSLLKENNPTLDRINLETWEGKSKKSTRLESNPLVAFVKAFISSFFNLWSE